MLEGQATVRSQSMRRKVRAPNLTANPLEATRTVTTSHDYPNCLCPPPLMALNHLSHFRPHNL